MSVEAIMISERKQLTMGGALRDKTAHGYLYCNSNEWSQIKYKMSMCVCISMIYYYILVVSWILLPNDRGT